MSHAHHVTALVHAKSLHMQNNNQSQNRKNTKFRTSIIFLNLKWYLNVLDCLLVNQLDLNIYIAKGHSSMMNGIDPCSELVVELPITLKLVPKERKFVLIIVMLTATGVHVQMYLVPPHITDSSNQECQQDQPITSIHKSWD